MTEAEIKYFLLVHDLRTRITKVEAFDNADEAFHAAQEAEMEYLGRETHEVVLVGSDSIESVKVTHSSYFDFDSDMVELTRI